MNEVELLIREALLTHVVLHILSLEIYYNTSLSQSFNIIGRTYPSKHCLQPSRHLASLGAGHENLAEPNKPPSFKPHSLTLSQHSVHLSSSLSLPTRSLWLFFKNRQVWLFSRIRVLGLITAQTAQKPTTEHVLVHLCATFRRRTFLALNEKNSLRSP